MLLRFTADFPPLAVHRGELTPEAYLAGETAGTPNREVALEELAACWLENANPAFAPYRELFDDREPGGGDRLPGRDRGARPLLRRPDAVRAGPARTS